MSSQELKKRPRPGYPRWIWPHEEWGPPAASIQQINSLFDGRTPPFFWKCDAYPAAFSYDLGTNHQIIKNFHQISEALQTKKIPIPNSTMCIFLRCKDPAIFSICVCVFFVGNPIPWATSSPDVSSMKGMFIWCGVRCFQPLKIRSSAVTAMNMQIYGMFQYDWWSSWRIWLILSKEKTRLHMAWYHVLAREGKVRNIFKGQRTGPEQSVFASIRNYVSLWIREINRLATRIPVPKLQFP